MDRKPEWLRVPLPSGERWRRLSGLVERRGLHTVCDSARCPNKAECWGSGTATFMILGGTCTRNCRYCAVPTARTGEPVLAAEAEHLAEAVAELGLSFAVITSVDRDDLADRGAAHFAACVRAIKARNPGVGVEVLCPDYREGEIEAVLDAGPTVFAHNVETVPRLQGIRDARASWEASIRTLRLAAADGRALVKSSLLLGLGETRDEVLEAMDLLMAAGARSLVLGQYLQPSPAQVAVREYLDPTVFAELAARAKEKGFTAVVSGPLVRTSYHARESSGHATRVLAASGARL